MNRLVSFLCMLVSTVASSNMNGLYARQGRDVQFETVFTAAYNIGITQDREGFIWIGTANGIVRYDGYHAKWYKAGPKSLSSNIAPVVFTDSQGLIWIGTVGGGLNVFDKSTHTFTVHKHDPDNPYSLSHDSFLWAVDQIAEDEDGLIWAGTVNGLNSYDKKTGRFTRYLHDPNDPDSLSHNVVWAIFPDREGIVWVGTQNGLNAYHKKTGRFTRYIHDPDDSNSLSDNWVYAVTQDRDGHLWIGTKSGGLNSYDKKTGRFVHYRHDSKNKNSLAHDEVFFIREDSRGDLWMGRSYSNPVGLERFDKRTGKFTLYQHDPKDPTGLSGNFIQSFLEDRSGILWVVDDLGPVNKYDRRQHRFTLYEKDPNHQRGICSHSITTAIEDRGGNVWLGTVDSGFCRYDRKTDSFVAFTHDPKDPRSLSHAYAYSLLEDSEGTFWVGTDDGILSVFDRESGTVVKRYQNPTTSTAAQGLLEDSKNPGHLWFGTGAGGLYSFDKASGTFTQYRHDPGNPKSLSHNSVGMVYQDGEGELWISTLGGGLNLFHRDTGTFSRYMHNPHDPTSIGSNDIRDCLIDSKGNFWIATSGGGLNRFDRRKGTFERFDKKAGFTTDVLFSIREDSKSTLWLSSDSGLFRFDPRKGGVAKIYTRGDGLQGDKFSFFPTSDLKTRSGEMWFAGTSGVNRFHPEKIEAGRMDIQHSPVYLTTIFNEIEQIFGMKIAEKDLDFVVDIDHGLPKVLFLDEARLRQILLNLVGNAVKFTERGRVTLAARPSRLNTDRSMMDLEIAVEDTGIGIPQDEQTLIFETFRQQTEQDTKKYGGTGLGLSICKRLIQLMNGQIAVRSELGRGSVFTVALKNVAVSSSEQPVVEMESRTIDTTVFEKATVLVVDDIQSNRNLLFELLSRANLVVLSAENSKEAISLAGKHKPDLVIMDIGMPVMDGIESFRHLKNDPKTASIPVVALTASPVSLDESRELKSEFDGYLVKPVTFAGLMKELCRFLDYTAKNAVGQDDMDPNGPLEKINWAVAQNKPELIDMIRKQIVPDCEHLNKFMNMQEIKKFADRIMQLGQDHNFQVLDRFGQELRESTESFDVAAIGAILKRLSDTVEKLIEKEIP
ncbi:MAG: response regulator [Proteobacteria bacterium]|nr:response regulator [Pseudomonadota bacterium]